MGLSLKSIGGFAKPALGKVVPYGDLVLGGVSLLSGAKKQGKADKLANQALALKQQRYQELQPLRTLGLAGLQNTQRPDLSGVYAGTSNPMYRPLRPQSPMMGATTPRGPEAEDPLERPMRDITMPGPRFRRMV